MIRTVLIPLLLFGTPVLAVDVYIDAPNNTAAETQAAPRKENNWKKSADVEALESLWKMIDEVNRTPLSR